tara:strand:+ start:2848 stop:3204 length:357 start_codon:yes stop_codon:yes gene_type:complete
MKTANRVEFMIIVNDVKNMMDELKPMREVVTKRYLESLPRNTATELTETSLKIFNAFMDDVSNRELIEHRALSHIKLIPFPDEEYPKPMAVEKLLKLIKDPNTDPAEINKSKKGKLDS